MINPKRFLSSTALLLSCLMLSGCSGKESGQPTTDQTPGQSEETFDWKMEGFAVGGEVEKKQRLWVTEYIPWTHEMVVVEEGKEALYPSYVSTQAYGDRIYQLYAVINPSDPDAQAIRWILEIYDTETMSSSVRELSFEDLGEENPPKNYYALKAMDLTAEDSFVFQWVEIEKNSEDLFRQSANRMIYFNPQGDIYKVDLLDAYLEKGIAKDKYSSNVSFQACCVCDGTGNTYHKARLSRYGYTQLYVMDKQGAVLLEYIGTSDQAIEDPMRTESGNLIYPVYDAAAHSYSFFWPDVETGEMRVLCTLNDIKDSKQRIKRLYGMQGNIVYYEIYDGIVAWDVKSGNRTLVLSYQENGISDKYSTMLVFREGQSPLLRLFWESRDDGDEDWLAPLSEESVQKEDALRVVDLVNSGVGSRQMSECAALVSRKDMNQTVLYQKTGNDADSFRTEIMAELAAGNGPDILYVSRADMALLYELGLLADLRELVPMETLEDLWPGAVSMGTVDGMLAGLPLSIVSANSLVVARDTWEKDTWQLEDIISLMDEGLLYNAVYYNVNLPDSDIWFHPWGATNVLVQNCLEDSFLIDWKKRECHFEDERFVHLLELFKGSSDYLSDDTGGWSHGGKSIAEVHFGSHMYAEDFDVLVDREDGHYVGYPTYGNGGNYFENPGILVVNANIKDKRKIETFLEYCLGDYIQGLCERPLSDIIDTAFTVRRYHTEDIEMTPEGEYIWHNVKLSVMEDGTTSLHRAIDFLESCVPSPAVYPDIQKLISEELEAYYNSDRSASETADIIDRRVQVYLDEEN